MRPDLYASKDATADDVRMLLLLVMRAEDVPSETEIMHWSPQERWIAQDWASREHLNASDNLTRRRHKPMFLVRHTQPGTS